MKRITIAIIIIILDQMIKGWVQGELPLLQGNNYPYGGIAVFQNFFGIEFSIVHSINLGAAWGFFADWSQTLFWFRIGVIGSLFYYTGWGGSPPNARLPFSIILGGAISNVLDSFLYGHVIDMFRFIFWNYPYPVFNIADSAICLGVVWLLFLKKV